MMGLIAVCGRALTNSIHVEKQCVADHSVRGLRAVTGGKRIFFIGMLVLGLSGCVSSGPQTQFFTLFPSDSVTPVTQKDSLSLGIGPIILPEYAERSGVVSYSSGNKIRVAGYHAWAGSLNENIARVLAADLSLALQADNVQAFPWDTRARPKEQIRIVFEQFGGIRGESVKLVARWQIVSKRSQTEAQAPSHGVVRLQAELIDSNIETYIAGLNELVNGLAIAIAKELAD